MVVQGRRAADAAAQLRASSADPAAARSDPLPRRPGRVRTAEKQRVEKLLEDAQIKLCVVASDIFGVSGRQMLAALIVGQRDPQILAQYARGRMRGKFAALQEAFTGRFSDHHAFLLSKMLARIDQVSADLDDLDAAIEAEIAPFARAAARLHEIPGVVHDTAFRLRASEVSATNRAPLS